MFVDIENYKSVLAIENLLTPYKKGKLSPDKKSYLQKEPITLDICWEVLRSTNAPRNIKDMLVCIAELSPSEQIQFKDVVLATFSNREQPNDILVLGKKLAHASNYDAEFTDAQKLKEGDFILSASQVSRGVIVSQGNLKNQDFSNLDKLIALGDDTVYLNNATNLPSCLEFPNAGVVYFDNCDLSDLKSLTTSENARIDFFNAAKLPENLKIDNCQQLFVNLEQLPIVKNGWSYPQDVLAYNSFGEFAPKDFKPFDFSDYSFLTFSQAHVMNLCRASFKKGASIIFSGCSSFPDDLDFSSFNDIQFIKCDLDSLKKIDFAQGAHLSMWMTQNIPDVLDVSKCADVQLIDLENELKEPSKIIFKNKTQADNSHLHLTDDWKKRIVFAEQKDNMQNNTFKRFLGKILGRGRS